MTTEAVGLAELLRLANENPYICSPLLPYYGAELMHLFTALDAWANRTGYYHVSPLEEDTDLNAAYESRRAVWSR